MSERHLEWLTIMTSPQAAAEWRLSEDKDGDFNVLRSWHGLYQRYKLVPNIQKLLLHELTK